MAINKPIPSKVLTQRLQLSGKAQAKSSAKTTNLKLGPQKGAAGPQNKKYGTKRGF